MITKCRNVSTIDFITYLLSCNHHTIFPFVGNVLSFLSWKVHFKWSQKEFSQCLGQVRGRTAPPHPRIYRVRVTPPPPLPPPPGNRLNSNHLTGFSGTISKGISREWEFYKIECHHVSEDKKKNSFSCQSAFCIELSLHLVRSLHFERGLQYATCISSTDRFPNTWSPKMAKHHEISEYVFDKYDLNLCPAPLRLRNSKCADFQTKDAVELESCKQI